MTTPRTTRVALVQLCATEDVEANLTTTERLVREAAAAGAEFVCLPEAFAFIGSNRLKAKIVERLQNNAPHPILDRCQALAAETGVMLNLGGHHEASNDPDHSYNTQVQLDGSGAVVATYRKIHLFDVQLADGTELKESAWTHPGCQPVVTAAPFGTLGLSICYDVRFPYLYQQLADLGAIAITVPSAFTATTGAAHWHTLLRARAIEAQCYVLAAAQHGQHNARRRSFGHSLIVDPWGEVVAELDNGDGILLADIDPERVAQVRRELPSLTHRVAALRSPAANV